MKYILPLIFILSCNSVGVKQTNAGSMSFQNLPCKQKILPLKVDYKEENDRVFIKFTAEKDIKDFEVKELQGLDGLKASLEDKPEKKDLLMSEVLDLDVPVTHGEGLFYINVTVSGIVNGLVKNQSIVVPVGKLSPEQKAARSKNIRIQKDDAGISKEGSKSSVEPDDVNVHVLKIE